MARKKKKKQRQTRIISYIFMLINTLIWGASLIVVKPALTFTTPFRFLFYRYLVAALIISPILIKYWPKTKKAKRTLPKIILIEFIGCTLASALLYSGLRLTTAIEASLITITTPIFIAILAVWFLKEKEETHELIGLAIAFIGTLLLTVLPLINGHQELNGISLAGNILIIGQNIATAIYWVLAKKHYQQIPKIFVAAVSFWVGLISFIPLGILEAGNMINFFTLIKTDLSHSAVWIAGLYMAVLGSIIGLTAYLKGQEGLEASEATLFGYLQPLVYIPLGIWFLHESVSILQIISLVIILLGVAFAEKRFKK
jgi:drug/metabolite transporter (DMT)-like permease